MFSSNQRLEISGTHDQLEDALNFALSFSGYAHSKLVFQITENGKYCIGWSSSDIVERGWEEFQFDPDTNIIAKIIVQFLTKQGRAESPYEYLDGCTSYGFLMKIIPESFSDEYKGIKNPFFGIVSFETFTNFYSK